MSPGSRRQQVEAGGHGDRPPAAGSPGLISRVNSAAGPRRSASSDLVQQRGRVGGRPRVSATKARCAGRRPLQRRQQHGIVGQRRFRRGTDRRRISTPAGTMASSPRAFAAASAGVIRLFRISRSGPNGERNGMLASRRSTSSGGFPCSHAASAARAASLGSVQPSPTGARPRGSSPVPGRRVTEALPHRPRGRHRPGAAGLTQLSAVCLRFLVLALADQAGQVEHRLADRRAKRQSVLEDHGGFFEHALIGQSPGATGIGVPKMTGPFRTLVLPDQLLEDFHGLLEAARAQCLPAPIRQNVRRGDPGCTALLAVASWRSPPCQGIGARCRCRVRVDGEATTIGAAAAERGGIFAPSGGRCKTGELSMAESLLILRRASTHPTRVTQDNRVKPENISLPCGSGRPAVDETEFLAPRDQGYIRHSRASGNPVFADGARRTARVPAFRGNDETARTAAWHSVSGAKHPHHIMHDAVRWRLAHTPGLGTEAASRRQGPETE